MGKSPLPASNKLRKEIIITLIVKLLFLYALWFLFFQESDKPLPVEQQFENYVFGQPLPPDSRLNNNFLLNKEP